MNYFDGDKLLLHSISSTAGPFGNYKGQTNGGKFAVFRRLSLIFASPGVYSMWEAQIYAENRRKPQNFAETRLSHLECP